jgi:hypothetical protein
MPAGMIFATARTDHKKENRIMLTKLDNPMPFESRLVEIEAARQTLIEAARQRLDARIVQHIEYRAAEIIDGMLASASGK